jgi:hypothetical protein
MFGFVESEDAFYLFLIGPYNDNRNNNNYYNNVALTIINKHHFINLHTKISAKES